MSFLQRFERRQFVFPLACAAAITLVVISEGSYLSSTRTLDELGERATAQMHLQTLVRSMLDAETSQRGFLLTNRPDYQRPYDDALVRVDTSLRFLDTYYAKDAERQKTMLQLHELIGTRVSELALSMRLLQEGKSEAVREMVLSGIGKENMDAVRTVSEQLLGSETRAVESSRSKVQHTLLLARIGLAIFNALCLLGLYMYMRQTTALKQYQQEQQLAVRAERDRLEREVQERTAQLTELAQHLQNAREDERSHLARDLHDELGALLTSAKLDAARIKSRLGSSAPEAIERLNHLVGTLNSGIALKRRIIEDLRPSSLNNLGLVATLEILAREYADRSGLGVHVALAPVQLKASSELAIYRVVQEAITNVTKYAQAGNVWIDMVVRDSGVEVSVRDDGVGFDTRQRPKSAHGLLGMRFRVEAEGGRLDISSVPGKGTRILALLPLSQPQEVPEAAEHLG